MADNLIKLPMQVQVLRLLLFVLTGFLRGQPINLDMQPVFQTISRNQVTPILLGREGLSSFTKGNIYPQ